MDVLKQEFFRRDTMSVALELLGTLLVRDFNGTILSGIINETEAYLGEKDSASHAFRGKTSRNSVMYELPGIAYVYFVYGKYYMLNVVTEQENIPHAVLIRSIIPVAGIKQMEQNRVTRGKHLTNGPAKLCEAMAIDIALNRCDLTLGADLWIEEYLTISPKHILSGPRIGIDYALQNDRNANRRFWISKESNLL